MRDRIDPREEMPGFWPPKPGRFWDLALSPLHRHGLKHHRIARVDVAGIENLRKLDPRDGALICPNHSYTGDGIVILDVGRRALREASRRFYTMAAWHGFRGHGGIDGFLLQHMGVFSVDREGCDRRAIRQATNLLASGQSVVIFPEGEIYHLNEKLTPLREGVAFMAATAQRDLEKSGSPARVWMLPTCIRYRFDEDITRPLERAAAILEKRLLIGPRPASPLHQRIFHLGEVLLTLKEKQHLGRSNESAGELPARLRQLSEHVLARREQEHLGRTNSDESVPVRVKKLRQKLLESACDESDSAARISQPIRDALADVHLALQLWSYPGDYLTSNPTPERMAETLEKFVEDMDNVYAKPIGRRIATVTIGHPIDVKQFMPAGKARVIASELTATLERELQSLMTRPAPPSVNE
jgi:hypothetical protein